MLTITSAKLVRLDDKANLYTLEVSGYTIDANGNKQKATFEDEATVHEDLFNMMQGLGGHYAVLHNIISPGEFKKPVAQTSEKLATVHVSGFSKGGAKKNPTIILTGWYLNYRDRACISNTPSEFLNGDYENMSDLLLRVEKVEGEVRHYLSGEKRGPQIAKKEPEKYKQQEIPMGGAGAGNTYPKGDDHASPDAMKRLKDDDKSEKPTTGGRRKPQPQTPANPSGGATP